MLADRIRMISMGKPKVLIDRSTPTVVINQPYSTEGNGGRKLVRLDNGWLNSVLKQPTGSLIYRSQDNASSWTMIRNIGYNANDLSVVSNNNNIYILYTYSTGVFMRVFNEDGDLIGSTTTVDTGQSALGNCSLDINKEGTELHACWASKNSTYPNSFNIRYCKGVINNNDTVTWGSVEQITTINYSTQIGYQNPTIVLSNNMPIILSQYSTNNSVSYSIPISYYNGSKWETINNRVTGLNNYVQSNPSACVDKDGVIHVTWESKEGEYYYIYYSKSANNGLTWSLKSTVYNTTSLLSVPSISVNYKNEVFVTMQWTIGSLVYKTTDGTSWVRVGDLISGASRPSTLDSNLLEFEFPLCIFQHNLDKVVNFIGKWYE